ncbi:MAG: Ldh family oxidoreductase [Planctomycetes bacterium]|nr:Ldh family oxidoreductase [Planctomycetota bacterium]
MSTRVSVADLQAFCVEALRRVGAKDSHARTVAEVLVMTDTWGTFTHGTKLLRDYCKRVKSGGLRSDTDPAVVASGPAWAIVDGGSCLGHVTSVFAMQQAIQRAKQTGIAYVGVRNSCHFGAAGYYAWLAAKEGLIGVSMANDIPSVAAAGSRRSVTGSNPLAYAVPTGQGDPILLDIASSTVAGGKVYAAYQRGEPIPGNWILDEEGHPSTDSSLYPAKAALTPLANHKGYGIALLIETLSGLLTGASITWQVGSWIWGDSTQPTGHGAAFIAIDIATMGPRDVFEQRITGLIQEIHAAPTADGVERVLVPHEREWNLRRQALVEGIQLPSDVVGKLAGLADDIDLHPAWLPRV